MKNLDLLVAVQLKTSPELSGTLDRRLMDLSDEELQFMEQVSGYVLKIAGEDLPKYCEGFAWYCKIYMEEEFYFRRHKEYRLKSFAQALEEVYNVPAIMGPYMRGMLLSQVWLPNHTRALQSFKTEFLPKLPDSFSILDIGPGHGFFSFVASQAPKFGHLHVWDVSQSSLDETAHCFQQLSFQGAYEARCQDIYEAKSTNLEFDGIVLSEVLEHLEHPILALENIHALLKPQGRLFLNVPINCPAPDHIYNPGSLENLQQVLRDASFKIEETWCFPQLGYSLETANRRKMAISLVQVIKRA